MSIHGDDGMANMWDLADSALCSIGRFVLLRPGLSGVLLLTTITLTFWGNGVFNSADPSNPVLIAASAVPTSDLDVTIVVDEAKPDIKLAQIDLPTETTLLKDDEILPQWYVMQVKSGDTLSGIFNRYDVSIAEALTIAKVKGAKPLTKLKLGRDIRLLVNADNSLNELLYSIDKKNTLAIKQTSSGYIAKQVQKPIADLALDTEIKDDQQVLLSNEKLLVPASKLAMRGSAEPLETALTSADISNEASIAYLSAEITHSLYVDARKAGLTVKQADQLGKVFSIKGLTRKLRKGDQFSVLYEKPGDGGEGNLLLAQLSHRGQTYQAIRFTDSGGKTTYFDAAGKSLHSAISRKPVNASRVSSHFSKGRMHPVLHVRRPHLGTDYAAPTGTPIKAAGDGVVAYRGYKGGYGNTITIKHDSKYTTLYAHMSRFNKNVKKGTVVKEGQVIGYVGKTGLASGPHLHYEIHVNNTPKNPLTVALPGSSVPKADRTKFLSEAKTLLAQLQLNQSTQLATAPVDTPASAS